MKIVITGGAGFIGTNLVFRLLREHFVDEIRVLDDFSTGVRRTYDDPRVIVFEGDIRDRDFVSATVEGAHRVIHLGAVSSVPLSMRDPLSVADVNVNGTLNVLEAARFHKIEHLVSASSSAIYGENPTLPKSEHMAAEPVSPYAVTKLATEALTNSYLHSYNLKSITFRLFNVFGPLQRSDHVYAAVVPKFLEAIKTRNPLLVYGDGTQTRDFISVADVVDVIAHASMNHVTFPRPVNLASGARISLNELIDLFREIHPHNFSVRYLETRPGDVHHSQASVARMNKLFPSISSREFRSSLEETYHWYLK